MDISPAAYHLSTPILSDVSIDDTNHHNLTKTSVLDLTINKSNQMDSNQDVNKVLSEIRQLNINALAYCE